MKRYVLAITGATGVVLGLRVLDELLRHGEVHLILSRASLPIIREETGFTGDTGTAVVEAYLSSRGAKAREPEKNLIFHDEENLWAPLSSGSFRTEGMFIVPCSMKTLSALSTGYADNLIIRAADVTLKEGRPLVISPRETPLNPIHLENMLKMARLGVRVVPPMPGFYSRPGSVEEMVDFMAGKIIDQMGLEHDLYRRWR
jgi:4-hydroxy-3-polyprenylbenzoate decarboxylase